MRAFIFLNIFTNLCLYYCNMSYAQSDIEFSVEASAYSEPIPIDAFTDDWQTSRLKTGDHAFAHGRVQLAYQWANIQYALFWRYDYLMSFSPDAAKLYYQYANDRIPSNNQHYALYIDAQQLESLGFFIGRSSVLSPQWTLFYGLNLLKGRHMLDGTFSGSAQTQSGTTLRDTAQRLMAHLNYIYDQPQLGEEELGWMPDQPTGLGASVDLRLVGQINPAWSVDFKLQDLFGNMRWDDAPMTDYRLRYDVETRPSYDIEGKLSADQVFWQKIPWQATALVQFKPINLPKTFADIKVHANAVSTQYQLGIYQQINQQTLGMIVEPQTKAIGVVVRHPSFTFSYLTDRLNTNQAHREQLVLSANYAW